MKKPLLILGTLILLFSSCTTGKNDTVNSHEEPVSVVHDTVYQEITFTITDSLEKISLEVYLSKLNKGVMRYRYKGDVPLIKRIPKLDTLLSVLFSDSLIDFDFNTLFWGRLNDSSNRDFSLAKRLVLFASNSKEWDKARGRPVSGDKNGFIKLLKHEFTSELAPLFKKYNYKMESVSAEKVLVLPAEKLPFWQDIKTVVKAQDKFPFDCQLWFTLSKIQ